MRIDRLMGEVGIARDSAAGRRQLERRMEERRKEGNGEEWAQVRRGWCFGDEGFREELLAQAQAKMRSSHYGGQKQEAAE